MLERAMEILIVAFLVFRDDYRRGGKNRELMTSGIEAGVTLDIIVTMLAEM